jgi:hypothetical protein
VCAHSLDQNNNTGFVINENCIDDNLGVTTGTISANREVLITNVLITPGEGQSLGDGEQVQLNGERVTSLGNWGHPEGASMNRQPYQNEFNIQNNNGVSFESIWGTHPHSETLDHEFLDHREDPGGG